MNVLLTGRPGSGKTTVCRRVIDVLKNQGYDVGGMISADVREGSQRVGFKLIDVSSGDEGILAHIDQKTGPRVSKYRVNMNDLEKIGVGAIQRAIEETDIIVIDEIGPMELYSEKFENTTRKALASDKAVLATIHHRLTGSLKKYTAKKETRLFTVTRENREQLPKKIIVILVK